MLGCISLNAQNEDELLNFVMVRTQQLEEQTQSPNKKYQLQHNHSVLKPLFIIYKSLFSEQFATHCAFSPSCSQFAIDGVKHKGFLFGMLLTFDRMTRCHTDVSKENSHLNFDPIHDVYLDPPSMY